MTYEYICKACGHEWEAEQAITASPFKDCPSCHAQAAQRQISKSGGFILKGGGWYSDLYSSAKPGSSSESPKETSGSKDSSAASKSSTSSDSTASSSESKAAATSAGASSTTSTPSSSTSS